LNLNGGWRPQAEEAHQELVRVRDAHAAEVGVLKHEHQEERSRRDAREHRMRQEMDGLQCELSEMLIRKRTVRPGPISSPCTRRCLRFDVYILGVGGLSLERVQAEDAAGATAAIMSSHKPL
jgi:hypothetical protein